jgi:peptidoglycan hydrolase-like protein with peptidoglycan-binding domain
MRIEYPKFNLQNIKIDVNKILALLSSVEKNSDEAVKWFRLAKARGVPLPDELLTASGVGASMNKSSTVKKTDNLIQAIQQRLTDLSYNPGPADDLYGKRTWKAIVAFQQKNGLEPDGQATVELLEALKNASWKSGQAYLTCGAQKM